MSRSHIQKLDTLQAGRGLAALAVVLFHANGALGAEKYFGTEPAPWARAGDSGVLYFFVLSGVVMMLAHGREIGAGPRYRDFLWRRFRRLVPPLWAALTVSLVAGQLMGLAPLDDLWAVAKDYLILPTENEHLLAVEWTLRREVVFYLLFALLIASRALGLVSLGLWFGLGLISLLLAFDYPANFWMSPFNLLFLAGMAAAIVIRRDRVGAPRLTAAIGLTLYGATWIWQCLTPEPGLAVRIVGFGLGATLIISGLAAWEGRADLKIPGWLRRLGDASYSIYLIHFLFVSALAKLTVRLSELASAPLWAWYAVVVLGATLGGYLFYLAVEKPLLALLPAKLSALRPRAAPSKSFEPRS